MRNSRTLPYLKCLCIFSLLLLLLLTGCWDRMELNKIGITSATAIDWVDGHWRVSYQIVIPQSISNQNAGGGSSIPQAPVMVFSTDGSSIQEAIQKSSLEMPRSLFFAHNRIIVIGEEAGRHGISELIDGYLRSADSRETVNVFVSRESGRSILEQIVPMEKIPGAALKNMQLNQDKEASNLKQVMMYQLAMGMTGDSGYTTVPEVIISGSGTESTTVETLKNTSFDTKLKLGRLGVFKKDKLIGWFTLHDGFGFSWITNQIHHTIFYLGCSKDTQNHQAAVRIYKAKTRLSPELKDGNWVIKADVQASAQLLENNCNIDVSKPEGIAEMEKLLTEELVTIMKDALKSAQSMKADVLGFASLIHKKNPKAWKQMKSNWEDHFTQMTLEPAVHIKLERIGMSSKPFNDLLQSSKSE